MVALAALKLVSAKKPIHQPPIVQRRHKLINKIFEQIQLAKAHATGGVYAPTKSKTVTKADGERVTMSVPKRIKPWWFTAENGKCCLMIRYGAKVVELAKGKCAIEIASPDALVETLETVKAAVLAGDLDSQIESISGQLRSGFKK